MNEQTEELTQRYAKQLLMYGELIELSKTTIQKMGVIRKELHIIQEELTKRGVEIKEVEEIDPTD